MNKTFKLSLAKALLLLLPFIAVFSLIACGDDIRPQRPITDKPGVVFLEEGRRDTVNTNISTQQLREALVASKWVFSYSFFYDDYEIGSKGEDPWFTRFSYDYREDGTVTATDLSYGKKYEYTYTVEGRTVFLESATNKMSFGVVALDDYHMVADESLRGQIAHNYDPASLTRRIVFYSVKK